MISTVLKELAPESFQQLHKKAEAVQRYQFGERHANESGEIETSQETSEGAQLLSQRCIGDSSDESVVVLYGCLYRCLFLHEELERYCRDQDECSGL